MNLLASILPMPVQGAVTGHHPQQTASSLLHPLRRPSEDAFITHVKTCPKCHGHCLCRTGSRLLSRALDD